MSDRKLPSLRKPDPHAPETGQPPAPAEPPREEPRRRRLAPRFNLKLLLVMMLVFAVSCAAWGGMRRETSRAFYVVFATAVPVLVLVLVGIVHQLNKRR